MIRLVDVKYDPISIEIHVSESSTHENVLFLWEDPFTKIPHHVDLVDMIPKNNFYSKLNRGTNHFQSNLVFKIISIKNYEVLFSHEIKKLDFLNSKKILYVSQNNYSGYSYAARNYIYQLLKSGYEVQWCVDKFGKSTYKPCNKEEELVFECINKNIDYECVIIHHVPDAWNGILQTLPRNKKFYGLTVWETTLLHRDWVNMINNSVDEVIVPSTFNKDVFKNSGINKKINVWYHDIFPFCKNERINVDNIFDKFLLYKSNKFVKDSGTIKDIIKNKTIYYNISQYNERKNITQVIRTFCKKFKSDDNVCLFIKTFFRSFSRNEIEVLKYNFTELLKNFGNMPDIIFCFDDLNDDEINVIHEFGDVYFTLNRGEGFGLCTYTAKKIGNKIICGKFGAEREFLNESVDILINYTLTTPFNMEIYHNWYNDDKQRWASYDDDDVISKLQYFRKTIKQSYNYEK